MKYKVPAIAVLSAGLAFGAAACGSSGTSASSGSSTPSSSAAPTQSAQTASKPFGPACSAVPPSGAGSFSGMSTAPVATAASNNPVLSTLVTAVKKANLVDTLNSAKGITVFAPENSAFAAIPSATLTKVLADKAELTKILTYHVVGGKVTTGDFSMGTKEKTLEGAKVTLGKMGSTYTVNGAKVVCGDVTTANATVYIIGSVLMPKS
ncbi:MAG TPA: fasciclin domain-containing protein [Streptosporangiaceae bacterium]|nr:fasciclin domain-containing protein [Streptosporangiaceae bacterium]